MIYEELFNQATGHAPYPYQRRLAHEPDLTGVLSVPTGLGKTEAVVVAWLWRRRYGPDTLRVKTPRRLVYCLPVRVLVSQTVERINGMLNQLGISDLTCATLMGGQMDSGWDESPESDQIIVGTQDQLISRALNRGFTMSRYRWPIHFAWLNSDVLWVMDEMQIMGPTVQTSAQLEAFRSLLGAYGPHHTIWMSATTNLDTLNTVDFRNQAAALPIWTLEEDDLVHPEIKRRVHADKPLTQSDMTFTSKPIYYTRLAQDVLARHRAGTLTLVVVNQVARAQGLASVLRESGVLAEIVLLHSRYRRVDRLQAEVVLGSPVPEAGRIVVATQVVEAGFDLSAQALFTELAPWSSMVQRFGRCNRAGMDADASITWIDVGEDKGVELPYAQDELDHARRILQTLDNATILDLPAELSVTRPISQVLRRTDLLALFDTASDLSDRDLDVSRFIRDRQSLDVSVLWRQFEDRPGDQIEPEPHELCPVSLRAIRSYLRDAKVKRKVYAFRYLDGQWEEISEERINPGQILLLRAESGGYDPLAGFLPVLLQPVEVLTTAGSLTASDETNQRTFIGRYVTLSRHLDDVRREAERLVGEFSWDWPGDAVIEAAAKHDWGKATEAFQETLLQCADDDSTLRDWLWAKSRCTQTRHRLRPRYRHELASALAALDSGCSNLVSYLVAAHHGKVRMSIRSVDGEKEPHDGRRFARGIWDGDLVHAVSTERWTLPEVTLSLDVMEIGGGATEVSWNARAESLLKQHGPFRLSVMEAMVRIADWRGTRKEMEAGDDAY